MYVQRPVSGFECYIQSMYESSRNGVVEAPRRTLLYRFVVLRPKFILLINVDSLEQRPDNLSVISPG